MKQTSTPNEKERVMMWDIISQIVGDENFGSVAFEQLKMNVSESSNNESKDFNAPDYVIRNIMNYSKSLEVLQSENKQFPLITN